VAAKIAALPAHRPGSGSASIEAVTQPEAAARLNVGRASVQRARVVLEKAEPELAKAVEQGGARGGQHDFRWFVKIDRGD
jgi:hypothetical protein